MPEFNDYPFDTIAEAMDKKISEGATCYQKWSCSHCGARQTMEQPNTMFTSGRCEECKLVTQITKCNYLMIKSTKGPSHVPLDIRYNR